MEGTHSKVCNDIDRQIILWCKARDVWLSTSHIPGKLNMEADQASREFNDDTEWSLDPGLLNNLAAKFAPRLNNKVDTLMLCQLTCHHTNLYIVFLHLV